MSEPGESARTPETAAPQAEVAPTAPAVAPAAPDAARPGAGRVMRKSLPRTTRDNDWAAGSGIEPASAPPPADDPSAIHAAAGEGIATPGGSLPHRARLEEAFGLDLSSIIGHTGAEAQASARAMGAGGYATGNHVVVPPDASVGLVAHEVTHVLQQDDGVQLAGGVDGGASDPLEQEAAAVGAAVERGDSVAGRFSAPRASGGASHVQRDTTARTLANASPPPPDKDQAEAIRRYRIDTATSGVQLASKRWREAMPALFAADLIIPLDLKIGRFKQDAYNLAAVDRTDVSPVQAVLEAPGREQYKTALGEALQELESDTPTFGQIKESIDNIIQGGQMTRNRTRLIAHHALLRPSGKRAMNEVPILGTKQLLDYLAGPAFEHGKLEDDRLGAVSATTHVPTVQAQQNAQGSFYRPLACRQLYDMFRNGAPKIEEPVQGAPGAAPAGEQAPAGPSPDVQLKVDALRAAVEKALGAVVKGADGVPVLPYGEMVLLDAAITNAGDEARDIIHGDTALMGRLATLLDPATAKAILDKLDTVDRLYKECLTVASESEPPEIEVKMGAAKVSGLNVTELREYIPFKPSSPVYSKIYGWLNTRRGKDKALLRGRLLEHTKLKDDFIDRLQPDESRIVYRLIQRGSEEPTVEDKVHEAAEKKKGADLVEALRELASSDPVRLKALEKDSVFRASASALNEQVTLKDGQLVRPWHVCMVMWGLDPGNTQATDPGTAKLSEMNASGNDKPLTIDERIKLEEGLLEPCIREIKDELDGKNDDQEFTYRGSDKMARDKNRQKYQFRKGDPQAVSNILCNYDRKATEPLYVELLQRERMVFGREIERRYQERFSVDLRTWIYENSGPVNRTGANRVLGNEQGASVGMFNGKMMAAGEMDQAGKMTLTQALREHQYLNRPIYEWASVSSRTIAAGLGNLTVVLTEWTIFEIAVNHCAPEITAATGINIRAIDLLRNAYMEHSGHFQAHLEAKYKDRPSELATIKERMGLTANVDVPPDAPPPSPAEQAERMYKNAADMLWSSLSVLSASSAKQFYSIAAVAMNARFLPRVPDDPKAPESKPLQPGQEGYTVEERPAKSFISYYRLMYGATPEHHAAAVLRAMSEPRVVPAAEAATIIGIDPKLVTGPWSAPGENAGIGEHNRHLVRASFTMEVADKEAREIWRTLHGSGRMDVIQTLLGHYNDEEQALIRAAFRALSGGFDLTFYVRQMMLERENEKSRLEGDSKEISLENAGAAFVGSPNSNAMMLAGNQWGYKVKVGAGLTKEGKEAAGLLGTASNGQMQSWSTDAELEQMLSISTSGNLDVRTRLRAACKRDSQAEIKTIVDELTVPERKQVLQDGPLMNELYSHLEQYDQERVYKILTGQGDLADRLYSRSHGGSWSERKLWGGTDEDGMRQDIRLYIRQMRLKHNADVRGEVTRMVEAGNRPPQQQEIDKEVTRRVADACAKLASNESVRAIMKSELDKDEFAEMESMLLNGSGEARDWAVAGGAGKNEILADIRAMSLEQRRDRLNDPNYMRLLGQRLRDEKDYRDALSALREGIGGGGSGLSKLDEASRSGAQASGASADGQKTLDALVALSQPELEALKKNPTLQVQVMAAMNAEQQAVAREYMAGPDRSLKVVIETADKVQKDDQGHGLWRAGAGGKGGTLADPTLSVDPVQQKPALGPDGKPLSADEAQKQAEAQLAAQKEDYVRFLVHQSIHRVSAQLRTKTSWSLVLEAAVEVYKADLPAVPSKGGDKASPRQIVWNGIVPHMKAFAVYHDAPEHYLEMTLQPITGAQMTEVVAAAVLGQADPTEALIESKISTKAEQDAHERYLRRDGATEAQKNLALKLYGLPLPQVPGTEFRTSSKDDVAREDDIKSAVESASDEKVIQNWTTYLESPPGGDRSHTMKARYDEYHAAFEAAKPAIKARAEASKPKKPPADPSPKSPPPATAVTPGSDPDAAIDAAADKAKADSPAPPPTTPLGPLGGDKPKAVADMELARARFLEFKVTESVLFEAMLRPFMGDDRDLTKAGTFDPNKSKIAVSKNKRYNNLVEALLQRATHLRPEAIAALLGIDKNDLWLLQNDMRGEVAQMALSEQKNLRYSGAQRAGGGTANEEKQQLDVTTFMLYKTFADASSDYTITGDEKELLSYRRDQNDRARDSYKTALETAAMWASLITSVLVTLAATILTGGLALGPIGMMAIGGVTMLLSAKAQAAVNKQILQDEFDMKDEKDLITKEVTTGLVTMGTTFFAQGLLSTLGKGARLFSQTALMKQVFQKPPSIWGVFLREASEEVISEGMDNVVSAQLEATNPEHFVDGMKIGAKRAHAASSAILSRAPDDMWAAAVTSLITAGVGKLKKGHGKPEFDAPKDARKRTVNLKKNLKMVFGDPEEKFSAAAIEWLVQQGQNGSIDWDNAPEELLKGVLSEYKESVHEVHGQYAHHGMQSRKLERHLATYGHYLQNSVEVKIFSDVNREAGSTDPFVSAKDFARIRTEVAVAGLSAFEQQNGPLTDAQRQEFIAYVREAPETDELHRRAKENPLSQSRVKFADVNVKPNTAVGKSLTDDKTAFKVVRDLADGKTDSLKQMGIEVPPDFDPTKNEWGLGRRIDVKTGEASYVLIRGEEGAVNWENFPGVEPIAHSHPDKGPNGRQSNHLKKLDADGGVDVVKLCTTDGNDRIHFLPSGADLVFVLAHGIKTHTVLTPFQSLGGGRIGNPTPGSNNAGINIVIKNPTQYGHLFGNPNSPVAEVEIEIWAGSERLHTMKLWGSDHLGGSHLWHQPPADMIMPVDLGAGGDQAGQRPRRTPSGQGHHNDDHDAPHNRPTQVIPAVSPDQDGHGHDQQGGHQQQSEYDKATKIWKDDQTSAAELKQQIGEEEYEEALGHVKEARLDPDVGPTIAHIPDHELVALYLYTDYHYRRWNLALRENDHTALQEYGARIKAADQALSQLPDHVGWVERGTNYIDPAIMAKYQPGNVVTEQAFTSASAGSGDSGGFVGGDYVFRIKSLTGKQIDKLAKRGDKETEVLFRPGTTFLVTGRTQQDHTTVITMEEVPVDSRQMQNDQAGGGGGRHPAGNDIAPRAADEVDAEAAGKPAREPGQSWLPLYDLRKRLGLLTSGERRFQANEQALGSNRGTSDPNVIATHPNVLVQTRPLALAEGRDILRALADGNADALRALGIALPADFDSKQMEWALALMKDGNYYIIRGDFDHVKGALHFGADELAAHSHPLSKDRQIKRPTPILEVLSNPSLKHLLSPSGATADVGLVRALQKHGEHTIYLPYQHLGNGIIGQSDTNRPNQGIGQADMAGRAPGLEVHMHERPRIVGTFGTDKEGNPAPVYVVPVEFKAGGQTLHKDDYVVYQQDGIERIELASHVPALLMTAQQEHAGNAQQRGLGGQVGPVDGIEVTTGAPHRAMGFEVLDFATAERALKNLAAGNMAGLTDIGMIATRRDSLPEVYWAVGQQVNGSFVLVRGDQHGVVMPPGVTLVVEQAPSQILMRMGQSGMPVSDLEQKHSYSRQSILPTIDRFQHFNSGTAVVRYDTGYQFQPPGQGEAQGRIVNPTPGSPLATVSVLLDAPMFVGRRHGDPVYRARATVLGSDGAHIWSGDVWVTRHEQFTTEPPSLTPPAEGETWVPVDTGRQPAPAPTVPGGNIGPSARRRGDDSDDDEGGGGRRRRDRDGDDDGGGRERNRDRRRSRDEDHQEDNADRPRIPDGVRLLQTGGHTFDQATADALNTAFGRTLERREWGRALERLKKSNGLGNDHHGRIWENGDYTDMDGFVIDNLGSYATSEGR